MSGGFAPLPFPTTADAETGLSASAMGLLVEGLWSAEMHTPVAVVDMDMSGGATTLLSVGPKCAVREDASSGTHVDFYLSIPGYSLTRMEAGYNPGAGLDGEVLASTAPGEVALRLPLFLYRESYPWFRVVLFGVRIHRASQEALGYIAGRHDTAPHPAYAHFVGLKDSLGELVTGWRELELVAEARALGALQRNAEKPYWNSVPSTAEESLALWAEDVGVSISTDDTPETYRRRLSAALANHGRVSEQLPAVQVACQQLLGRFFDRLEISRPWSLTSTTEQFWDQRGCEVVHSHELYSLIGVLATASLPSTLADPTLVTVVSIHGSSPPYPDGFALAGVAMTRISATLFVGRCPTSGGLLSKVGPNNAQVYVTSVRASGWEARDVCNHPGECYVSQNPGKNGSGYMIDVGGSRRARKEESDTFDFDSKPLSRWPSYDAAYPGCAIIPVQYTAGLGRGTWSSSKAKLTIRCFDAVAASEMAELGRIIVRDLSPVINTLLPSWVDWNVTSSTNAWRLGLSGLGVGTVLA